MHIKRTPSPRLPYSRVVSQVHIYVHSRPDIWKALITALISLRLLCRGILRGRVFNHGTCAMLLCCNIKQTEKVGTHEVDVIVPFINTGTSIAQRASDSSIHIQSRSGKFVSQSRMFQMKRLAHAAVATKLHLPNGSKLPQIPRYDSPQCFELLPTTLP